MIGQKVAAIKMNEKDRKREKIRKAIKEGILTEIQGQALISKLTGKRLTSNERSYIYNLKQIIQRGEENLQRIEALKKLLRLLGINPYIGGTQNEVADRVCPECGNEMVYGYQNYYCKGKQEEYLAFFEDIPSLNCTECDNYLIDFETTIKILDELLEYMDKKVNQIQQRTIKKLDEKFRCPICHYKYLEEGKEEIYRFKRCNFNLVIRAVPVNKSCKQCDYFELALETEEAINELVDMVDNYLKLLRNSGWKTEKNES
jgi:mRNA-degrading endonuclease RelE of RelBE toxin-antitoxin system